MHNLYYTEYKRYMDIDHCMYLQLTIIRYTYVLHRRDMALILPNFKLLSMGLKSFLHNLMNQ